MTQSPSISAKTARYKLPAHFAHYAFAFFMAAIMAAIMCSVIVAANTGFAPGYLSRVLHAYVLAMPTAFLCVLFVRPLVLRLVHVVVRHE